MKIHNRMAVVFVVVVAAVNSTTFAANFPVGTHLVKGTLKDWQNKVLTSSAAPARTSSPRASSDAAPGTTSGSSSSPRRPSTPTAKRR